MYIDYIKNVVGFTGSKIEELNEVMLEIEKTVENLIGDEEIGFFIYSNWLSKMYDEDDNLHNMKLGEMFEVEDVINKVKSVLVNKAGSEPVIPKGKKVNAHSMISAMMESKEIKKDPGAVKLWEGFKSHGEDRELAIYLYVKAFCGIKTSGDRLVIEPKPYKKVELTTGEKVGNSIAFSIIGKLLDVTGLGMVTKLDEMDEKKVFERKRNFYNELREELDNNILDEILRKPKFDLIRKSIIGKFQNSQVTNNSN